MVRITGGTYGLGVAPGPASGDHDGHPRVQVRMSSYCVDRDEVTVSRFRTYWNPRRPPTQPARIVYPGGRAVSWPPQPLQPPTSRAVDGNCTWTDRPLPGAQSLERHPINCVDWYTAQSYCASRGARLPTEAEWDFAARGTAERQWPWGAEPGPTNQICWATSNNSTCVAGDRRFAAGDTPEGVHDLSGGVWEWVADAWIENDTAFAAWSTGTPLDPANLPSGVFSTGVVRGGSFGYIADSSWLRASSRSLMASNSRQLGLGFRCARSD